MPNLFNLLTTFVLIIVAVAYLSNAFLSVDHANRQGCEDPYTDENGTLQNCSIWSDDDYHQINNTENAYGTTTIGIDLLLPLLGLAVLVGAFMYLWRAKK